MRKDRIKGDRPDSAKSIDHLTLPVGKVLSDPIKGTFLSLPLFGWVSVRGKKNTPLVMLTLVLLKPDDVNPSPKGALQVEMPVMEETELATLEALERFGWDGRIWPEDAGWPIAGSEEEESLFAMIGQAGILKNIMTFPPSERGATAVEIEVTRARGPFLMPPLPKMEGEPNKAKLDRLRELCESPAIFYLPGHN